MNRKTRPLTSTAVTVAAALFLLLHLPYLPKSLEDVDSINFAMGIRDFDVAHHQPHPPGYPVFIALAKGLHLAGASEVHALALLSVIAGALGVFALLAFFAALGKIEGGSLVTEREKKLPAPIFATLLAVGAPLYWFTAARPLTDATGLAAALAVQALILSATSDRALVAASFLSAFATGLRSQVAWLTVPLLVFALARRAMAKRSIVLPSIGAFVVGGFTWGVPLVMLTGGPMGYWRAVASQGNEDLTNIVMLWTTHTLREARLALYNAFVAPWAVQALAAVVLGLAAIGVVSALRKRPRALLMLALAFGPYLLFDLVFQETITIRYSLPLVVPVAYLAMCGAEMAGPVAALVAVAVAAAYGMHLGGSSIAAYASQPAPAFRMLDEMKREPLPGAEGRVLAMHRREDFDLRRPLAWAGAPAFTERLPAPPKHEWLEVVKYWNGGGGRSPVWFIADPLRSDLALLGNPDPPESYRWSLESPILLGGTRPSEMDWYVLPPPDWYLGEGWALTPETAGIAEEDGRGPGRAPIEGWVRRDTSTLVIGGRNLGNGGAAARVRVSAGDQVLDEADVAPGFFLRVIRLARGALAGVDGYARLTVSADTPAVAIEQFDAKPAGRIVMGYGEGWHEREYTPATGKLWRWTSDHGVLRVVTQQQALALDITGEVEAAAKSRVTIRVGDRIVAAHDIGETFTIHQVIPKELVHDGENTITISTDQTYVPAERRSRTADKRLLGLKIYTCRITPAS